MLLYLKLLEAFLLNSLMKREEYTINHKNFNPLKILLVFTLIINLAFTFHLYVKLSNSYNVIHMVCPNLIVLIYQGKNKQQIYDFLKANEFKCNKEELTPDSPDLEEYLKSIN